MARVITAKRAGTCGDCTKAIAAGERINYGGPGAVTHEACKPLDAARAPRNDRRRLARGQYGYRGYAGYSSRCEDAPCCGCCG